MKTNLLLLMLLLASCASSTNKNSKEEWVSLFNGKDLEGWNMKIKGSPLGTNYKNTFRVEDGLLKVSYDQ